MRLQPGAALIGDGVSIGGLDQSSRDITNYICKLILNISCYHFVVHAIAAADLFIAQSISSTADVEAVIAPQRADMKWRHEIGDTYVATLERRSATPEQVQILLTALLDVIGRHEHARLTKHGPHIFGNFFRERLAWLHIHEERHVIDACPVRPEGPSCRIIHPYDPVAWAKVLRKCDAVGFVGRKRAEPRKPAQRTYNQVLIWVDLRQQALRHKVIRLLVEEAMVGFAGETEGRHRCNHPLSVKRLSEN